MTLKPARALHLVGLLLLSTFGCVEEEPAVTAPLAGGVRVVVAAPRAVTPLFVGASAGPASMNLTQAPEGGPTWAGSLKPDAPGEEVFLSADVMDSEDTIAASMRLETGVRVPRYGEALAVLVPTLTRNPPQGLANHAPNILAVTGPTAIVGDGETVDLLAHASDPDADALTYAWTTSSGVLDCAEASCQWTAALPKDADERRKGALISLQVTDARGAVSTLQFRIAVGTVRGPAWLGDTRFNRAPIPSEAGEPQQVMLGSAFQVQATVTDEDGPQEVLTYAWSATCEGTFDNVTLATPAFKPTAEPTDGCACQLKGAVTDGFGGSTTQLVNLCVRAEAPPVLETTSQSATSALAGERVTFTVAATDPRGEGMTFAWSSNVGALGTPVGSGATSTVDWTELSCLPAGVTPTVELVVTNASGASSRHSFPVEWMGRRCGPGETACAITLSPGQVTLREDCVVQSAVFIPDGYTFDGGGHTLTASEDGAGANYKGAVLRNRGAVANVRFVTVTARNLSDVCDAGGDRLRGILLEDASGTIENTAVEDLNQGSISGCQEGFAIDVRNSATVGAPLPVVIRGNRLLGYQKVGVVVQGRVAVTLEDNTLDGLGPTGRIARTGIQLSYGVSGQVVGNEVQGNAYQFDELRFADYGSGILVVGGSAYGAGRELCHDLLIQENELVGNDVGVNLIQAEGNDYDPPATPQNIQVIGNELSKDGMTNQVYQAAISDNGTANLISRNRISGDGYNGELYENAIGVDVVTQGDERQVGFATPARTLDVGTCSEELVVQGWDLVGNLAALSVPEVTLAASDPGATFHLLPDCSDAPVTEVSLKNAQREGLFFVRAATAGPLTVTATGDGASKSQDQTVR
ncbi:MULTISPECIES: right-handed parallel beta-helix repeat-containing protein [unclassified Corallococcus]|uniref:right-handed parallel beta-helix repeat-containing protein n=1 Tax=unclassified Corallococcus TaxID=2685029 RepID=UPI001A8C518B|nr:MULTISPECIES: right-handed parallel beta-helix repeat-containing protein [unclassified Corallococcus]MBN9681625.1 right-handed parallel beta-helix repeat-containing protein [Corallococcus sp. NCSPR001]WAS86801.1 right-handed parallel beta-helix repeat-containing protein [Corallococcus sp. NCRR]